MSSKSKIEIKYKIDLFLTYPVYANYIGPSVMTDANCEGFPICDDRITENDRCVIKIIGIHCLPTPKLWPGRQETGPYFILASSDIACLGLHLQLYYMYDEKTLKPLFHETALAFI